MLSIDAFFKLKVSGPRVQSFCIDKESYMDAIFPKHRKYNSFCPPPPNKKVQGYELSRYGYTQVFVYISSLLPGFLLGRH